MSHGDLNVVILTGGTVTALSILEYKPTMKLITEMGGKNATIVTALVDREQSIKNVIRSAFDTAVTSAWRPPC